MTTASPEAGVSIRPMQLADVPRVVDLQAALLGESAVTQLGAAFLRRFYTVALARDVAHGFVACAASGAIVGAALATGDNTRFSTVVTPRVAPWLAAALATRWRLAVRFAAGVFETAPPGQGSAELLLLFVAGSAQRSGLGARLLERVEDDFAAMGLGGYRVSLRSEVPGAQAFYLARGFQHEQEVMVLGRPMTYLTKALSR